MTLYVKIGRRVPRKSMRRVLSKVKNLVTFQENMWNIVSSSMKKARTAAKRDGRLKFKIEKEFENEDMFYVIEWMLVTIQGTEAQEIEEEEEASCMYDKLEKHMKSKIDPDENMSKQLKSKLVSPKKITDAYEKGFGAVKNKNISNKLLEIGIMTHIERIPDYAYRDTDFQA